MADQLRVGQRILYRVKRLPDDASRLLIREGEVKRVTTETVGIGDRFSIYFTTFLKSEVEVIEVLSNA